MPRDARWPRLGFPVALDAHGHHAHRHAGLETALGVDLLLDGPDGVIGYGILSGAPTDWWDPSAFTSGLVAMQWTGLWAMPGIKKGVGDDFGPLLCQAPRLDQRKHSLRFIDRIVEACV